MNRSFTCFLNITVNDINESPIFLSTPFSVSIAENLQTGVNVMRVKASDEDSGDSLTYSLSGTNSSHFAISSSTGLVTTAQLLDKETVGSYSLNVTVTDGTSSVTESLSITVSDVNDEPAFNDVPYATTVVENDAAAAVYTVSATDDDGDSLTFTVTGSVDFLLNPTTGVVTLADALDYENTSVYYLTIRASESNGGVATTNLNITVIDQTSDSPQFLSTPYTVNIGENLPVGTTVIKVVASDQDPSDSLTYSLSGTNNNHFSIGSSIGVISTAQELGRENINSNSLTVSVSDGSVTVTKAISISVDNGNDPPTFSNAPFNVSINENVNSGNLLTVSATDDDDAISFSIYGVGSDLSSVHLSSGVVSLVGALDYETVSGYTLTIRASDANRGVATTSLYVDVVNQNDDPGFLGTPYSSSVSEDTAVGGTVLVLTASDKDGDTLTFTLIGSNDFSIGSATGIITISQVLLIL